MNINYEDIITKANARKDALKALEVKLTFAGDIAEQLIASLHYFMELREMALALDSEGRVMAAPIFQDLLEAGQTCYGVRNNLQHHTSNIVAATL